MGTGFRKGGYLRCPPLLHTVHLHPLRFSSKGKLTEGTLVWFQLLTWSQLLTWIFDQWLVPLTGLFQRCSRRQPAPDSTPHTPPHSSHSKAWATPNVNDVSLAIVHGWPHLNGWLVPWPAPYNGLLSHCDLFSAFPPSMKRGLSLPGSLSSLVRLRILEPELNWKRWSKRWREKAR